MIQRFLVFCGMWIPIIAMSSGSIADEIDVRLQTIAACGPQGEGAAAAQQAARELSNENLELLPRLLAAMDTDNVLAANWYRTVYERLTRRELQKPQPQFPVEELREFVRSPDHQGRSRRLVLSLLDRIDDGFRQQFVLTQIADAEFRSDAVAAILTKGDQLQKEGHVEEAAQQYETAFRGARDPDQIQAAAAKLKSIDREVSIIDHMGFVIDWYVLGPFGAPDKTGFDTSFPPEEKVDLEATYVGQDGGDISWRRFRTADRLGEVNLVTAIAPVKEAVGYAYAEIDSPCEQDVELRCGADDNLSVWLNGEKAFSRLQWLNGTRLDRFSTPVHLRGGKNVVLVKICQGPQHKNPTVPNNWSMQLRFCDKDGAGVGIRSALPDIPNADSK